VVGVGVAVGDGEGDTVADGGGVVRGAVVRGGAGVDTVLVAAGVVGAAVAVALGADVYRGTRDGAAPVGWSGGTAGADEPAGEVDPVGECRASVGAGRPGASGCGEDEDVGRSAIVAPTKANTTTTAPTAAPISASRRRRRAPAGTSTYRS